MPLLSPCPCCLASPLLALSLQALSQVPYNWPCPVCLLPMPHALPDPDPSLDPSHSQNETTCLWPNLQRFLSVWWMAPVFFTYLSSLCHLVFSPCPRVALFVLLLTPKVNVQHMYKSNTVQNKDLSLCVSKATCLWNQRHLLQSEL
jgi:hypothetical protein